MLSVNGDLTEVVRQDIAGIFLEVDYDLREQLSTGQECVLLTNSFAIVVQGVLLFSVISTLLLKWYLEKPRRETWVFLLDGSKQMVGAGIAHIGNLTAAIGVATYIKGESADECTWYWTNIMVDTTIGVLFNYLLLQMTQRVLDYKTGDYIAEGEVQDVVEWSKYLRQVSIWATIVIFGKLLCVGLIIILRKPLSTLGTSVLSPIEEHSKLKLLVVMLITPTIMNCFQFLVTDQFIKYHISQNDDPHRLDLIYKDDMALLITKEDHDPTPRASMLDPTPKDEPDKAG